MSFLLKRTTKHNENYYPNRQNNPEATKRSVYDSNTPISEAGVQIQELEGICQYCPWPGTQTEGGVWPGPDVQLAGGHSGSVCIPCLGTWGSERK